jgi:hypothetical protein
MSDVKFKVSYDGLEADIFFGTYPVLQLVMTKTRDENNVINKFRLILTAGAFFGTPGLECGQEAENVIKRALKVMDGKIMSAPMNMAKHYPPFGPADWIWFEDESCFCNSIAMGYGLG